jgi:hypothetical protein
MTIERQENDMTRCHALSSALLFAAALMASPAAAHDPKPRYGGTIVTAGAYHVELVAKDRQIQVHLLDHGDKPVAAKGRKGIAILVVDGKSVRIPLESADGVRFSGEAPSVLPASPKGVVQITEPTGGTVQARFN